MFAPFVSQKEEEGERRPPDDWFESYTPPHTAAATRAAIQVQKLVRRQMIDGWLAELPAHVRPVQLAARYPDVVLMLIERWDNRSGVTLFLDELMLNETLDARWLDVALFAEITRLARFVRSTRRADAPAGTRERV